jgi:hypothetical protein
LKSFLAFMFMVVFSAAPLYADQAPSSTPESAGSPDPSSFETQKQKLELKRLQLENEKLQMELNQMKAEKETPVPVSKTKPTPTTKEELASFQEDESKKSEALAKADKDEAGLFVFDFVNSEVWYKGTRFYIHQFYDLAEDQNWKILNKVYEYNPSGYARRLFQYRNVSLLKYDGAARGIFTWTAPKNPGDFRFTTPEGVTSESGAEDIRDDFQSIYFEPDGQKRKDKNEVLRYKHSRGLDFADRLEFTVDPQGKILQIRYGVLDEH